MIGSHDRDARAAGGESGSYGGADLAWLPSGLLVVKSDILKKGMVANAEEPRRKRRPLTAAEKKERWADQTRGVIWLNADGTARNPDEQDLLDRRRAMLRKLGFIK